MKFLSKVRDGRSSMHNLHLPKVSQMNASELFQSDLRLEKTAEIPENIPEISTPGQVQFKGDNIFLIN